MKQPFWNRRLATGPLLPAGNGVAVTGYTGELTATTVSGTGTRILSWIRWHSPRLQVMLNRR